jgi:hypothetical protein
VYNLSRGKYFLLAHHDDIRALDYLQRTVGVMESDPSVVICYSRTQDIDAQDRALPRIDPVLRFDSPHLRERFHDVIRMDHICEPDFGLTRMDILRRTTLHGEYADSDRVLLAELALYGRFVKIPECLFYRRAHPLQSTAIAPDRRSRTVWFNPKKAGKFLFPHFRQFVEYHRAINRAPLSMQDRAWCRLEMLRWIKVNRSRLFSDIELTVRDVARPIKDALLHDGET